MPPEEEGLYGVEQTSRLILYWCLFWLAVHHLAWPLWKQQRVCAMIFFPTSVERYRRRLCRSQVYCAFAVAGGLRLLLGCSWSGEDLLYAYSTEHQLLFSMAAAHWFVSVWEDLQNWTFLRGGLSAKDMQNGADPSRFLWHAYLVHHLVAAAAFVAALRLKVCTGLAAFGLVFEMPVLYMNHREFIVYADTFPEWFRDPRQVEYFWSALRFWFRFARGVPSLVYFYSLFFWSEDLKKLSTKEAWTYHGMALFFTVLNMGLAQTFLTAWEKKDLDLANSAEGRAKGEDVEEKFRQLLNPANEAQTAELAKKEEQCSVAENLPEVVKRPLMQVTPELFANHAKNEEGELWVEIDNVAYNLTELLGNHPGGDNILRKFAGKDASKAFHKAKHSMKAKMQMQLYCIGPIVKELKEYRIFEHAEALREISWEFIGMSLALGVACWVLPISFYGSIQPLGEGSAPAARLLAPGLAMTLGSSTLLIPGMRRLNPANWTVGSLAFAVALTAFLLGLQLARHPVRGDLPSGLEIGASFIFALEEVFVHMDADGCRYFYWRRLTLAAGALSLSWSLRGASLDMVDTDTEHVLGGVLIALSIPFLCRLTQGKRREVLLHECLTGLAVTTLFGFPTLCFLLAPSADLAGLQSLASHAWASWTTNELIAAVMSSTAALTAAALIMNEAFAFSPRWASRFAGLALSVAVGFAGGLSGWRWLGWAAWFTLIGTLGHRNNAVLNDLQKQGKLGDAAKHKIASRSAWEMFYLVLGALLWQVGQGLFKLLINFVMPKELQFYAPWLPFFELGEDVDVGVAAYYAPKEGLQSEVGPHHFVCSVRHMDTLHPDGERDLQLHRNTVRDMWMKCKDTSAGGLVANVNCFFPRLTGSAHCKEINLSGWLSEKAAKDWSAAHAGLPGMQSHLSSRGQMRTQGSIQAYLKTHGEIRHQDRCSSCARLVESETLGEKAPERCRFCGKKNYGYPFF